MFDEQYQTNLAWWEERAQLHPQTPMYQRHIQALHAGRISLHELELAEVGEVTGKRLLHLQCHIGTDSLSWVRLGAEVTGVDFSPAAIAQARQWSVEFDLPATFIEADVYSAAGKVSQAFDIVFSSYGAIIWLHDLTAWAQTIADCLRPGGFFYLADAHPMLMTIDEAVPVEDLSVRLKYPYFEQDQPYIFEDDGGSYADPHLPTAFNRTYEWPHSFGDVFSALLCSGLAIEHFAEHREAPWPALPCCVQGEDGLFRLPAELAERIPLIFSLRARKPAA